jgi:hypothetical protein
VKANRPHGELPGKTRDRDGTSPATHSSPELDQRFARAASSRHGPLLHSLAAGSIVVVCFHQGCGSETEPAEPTGSGPAAAVGATNGTGYDPICNGGRADGFCNALGDNPETCDCRDCIAARPARTAA